MANQRSNEAAIKNLENQVGQLAKQLSEQQPVSSFPASTQTNPREHCKAIVTRSGKEINGGIDGGVIVEDDKEIIVENQKGEVVLDDEGEKSEEKVEEELVEKERKEKEGREKNDKKVKRNKKRNENVSTIPLQHLPYPHVQSRKEDARRYARFMDIFKQLHVNIPFSEALEKMPKYAKFMKQMLTKKKKYTDEETVVLDAHCSAIIQKTPPRKEADPGRVILPITIGGNYISNGLVDLGSSINLIPLSVVKRLGNIEMKHTRITLQLADKSIISPYGVVQDMLPPKDEHDNFRIDDEKGEIIEVENQFHKDKDKANHEGKTHHKNFEVGQMVLVCNSRLKVFSSKLKSKWSGPFVLKEVRNYGSIVVEDPKTQESWTVKEQRLKGYHDG
ncbi:uncharacterized protein LOC131649086 [Vicia villosa]|uniref:uncharacterized protein LOC131649086 n=1 Tax=Vicia villosa TaxID=3911 RepID=UPI00273A9128|nr:uncharacterized protein LOC131649086 [Vicia villosa]